MATPGTQLDRQQTVGINRPTFLFRNTFEVSDVGAVKFLDFDVLIDDGAVFYVNGIEVHRLNVSGAFDQSTYATAVGDEDAYSSISIDLAAFTNLLHDGTNVLAVELKNANSSSSDIGFGVALNLLIDYEADFDRNGVVDGQDLTEWELAFGTSNGADDDGDTDGADFRVWQQQFGSGGGAPLAAVTIIPEPSSLLLAALGLVTLSIW